MILFQIFKLTQHQESPFIARDHRQRFFDVDQIKFLNESNLEYYDIVLHFGAPAESLVLNGFTFDGSLLKDFDSP